MLKHNDKQRNLDKCMQKSKIVLAGVAVVPLHLVFGSSVGCKGAKGAKGKRQLWTSGQMGWSYVKEIVILNMYILI